MESARQLIASQNALVKDYHANYTKKVKVVENQIKKAKSEKKIESLNRKLIKRQTKQLETMVGN